jgi:hypothetical protein
VYQATAQVCRPSLSAVGDHRPARSATRRLDHLAAARGRMLAPARRHELRRHRDVVAGHIAAAERAEWQSHILPTSYRVVAAVVCEAVGRRAPAVVLPTWSLRQRQPSAAARAVWDRVPIAPPGPCRAPPSRQRAKSPPRV